MEKRTEDIHLMVNSEFDPENGFAKVTSIKVSATSKTHPIEMDELVGSLLAGYLKTAEEYIETHNQHCKDSRCNALDLHQKMVIAFKVACETNPAIAAYIRN